MSARPGAVNHGEVRGVFIFALLAAFALLSLVVVVVGARSYRMINAIAEQAYVSRTGMSYLIGKVRGADAAGALVIRDESGISVLVLGQEIEQERYNTYISCAEGEVREYFARADLEFSPDYGELIFAANSLTFSLQDNLLAIKIIDVGNQTHEQSLCLLAAKEGGA
jgi:hypothetical protein